MGSRGVPGVLRTSERVEVRRMRVSLIWVSSSWDWARRVRRVEWFV